MAIRVGRTTKEVIYIPKKREKAGQVHRAWKEGDHGTERDNNSVNGVKVLDEADGFVRCLFMWVFVYPRVKKPGIA